MVKVGNIWQWLHVYSSNMVNIGDGLPNLAPLLGIAPPGVEEWE